MKKIFFLITIILLGIFNIPQIKAQDPCDICIAPKMCYTLNLNVPGCGNITYILCYQCFAAYRGVNVDIYDIDGICPGYEDAVWDSAYSWVSQNVSALCGNQPCNEGTLHVRITIPICGTFIYDGNQSGRYRIKYDPDCDRHCIQEYDWCVEYTPRPRIVKTNRTCEISGTDCTHSVLPKIKIGEPKEINCQYFDGEADCMEFCEEE